MNGEIGLKQEKRSGKLRSKVKSDPNFFQGENPGGWDGRF